jgi:hypothetical protein
MPQMNELVHQSAKDKFLGSSFYPTDTLKLWLALLHYWNIRAFSMIDKSERKELLKHEQQDQMICNAFLPDNYSYRLLKKYFVLRNILRNEEVTHQQLLSHSSPLLGNIYEGNNKGKKDTMTLFSAVTNGQYGKGGQSLLTSMDVAKLVIDGNVSSILFIRASSSILINLS